MKSTLNMPERMRAHIAWIDGLAKPRRLLHWLGSSSCPECEWRRQGQRTLQRIINGQDHGGAVLAGAPVRIDSGQAIGAIMPGAGPQSIPR